MMKCENCFFFQCFYCDLKDICKYAFLRSPRECKYFRCSVKACETSIKDAIFFCPDDPVAYDVLITTLKCSSYCGHVFHNSFDKNTIIRAVYASDVNLSRSLSLIKELPVLVLVSKN